MVIREATIWDVHKIVPLWTEMHKTLEIPFVRLDDREKERFYVNLLAQIKRDGAFVAVAVEDDEIIGFVHGSITYRSYGISEPIALCEGAYINPKGGGMKLIEAFESWADSTGTRHIMFESTFNERLPKIWSRRGYKAVQIMYHRED